MKIRKLVARSVTFVAAVTLSGTVLAQGRQMTVHYADLNISTASGATTLYHRIVGAARSVCGEEPYEPDIDARRNWNDCFRTAVNDAVESVHSPLLTAVHNKSTPHAPVAAMLSR